MSKQNDHPRRDLMIFCRKCGAFSWHEALDARWAQCLGCGDLADLADPATRIGEINHRGKRETRV
jgi:hypothetical protein